MNPNQTIQKGIEKSLGDILDMLKSKTPYAPLILSSTKVNERIEAKDDLIVSAQTRGIELGLSKGHYIEIIGQGNSSDISESNYMVGVTNFQGRINVPRDAKLYLQIYDDLRFASKANITGKIAHTGLIKTLMGNIDLELIDGLRVFQGELPLPYRHAGRDLKDCMMKGVMAVSNQYGKNNFR